MTGPSPMRGRDFSRPLLDAVRGRGRVSFPHGPNGDGLVPERDVGVDEHDEVRTGVSTSHVFHALELAHQHVWMFLAWLAELFTRLKGAKPVAVPLGVHFVYGRRRFGLRGSGIELILQSSSQGVSLSERLRASFLDVRPSGVALELELEGRTSRKLALTPHGATLQSSDERPPWRPAKAGNGSSGIML